MHGGRASDSPDTRKGGTSQPASQPDALVEPLRLLAEVSDDVLWVMDAKTRAIVYVSNA